MTKKLKKALTFFDHHVSCISRRVHRVLSSIPQLQFVLFGLAMVIVGYIVYTGSSPGNINVLAIIMIYSMVALGLNLLLGYGGLISLSTAPVMGLAAHGMRILVVGEQFGQVNYFLAIVIVLVLSVFMGLLIGLLSLKMEGIYLAIATLFFGYIIAELAGAFELFSYGQSARMGAITFFGDTSLSWIHDIWTLYLIVVATVTLVVIGLYNILKSPTGRAFMAISRSQHAALAMGISVRRYRFLAFVISTVVAAIGGILYVTFRQRTGAFDSRWNLELSLILLAIVVVGGLKSFFGMFLGAMIIIGIPEFYFERIEAFIINRGWFGESFRMLGFSDVFAGLMIVLAILFYPRGAIMIFYTLKAKLIALKQRKAGRDVSIDVE